MKKRKQHKLINEINDMVIVQLYQCLDEWPIDEAWNSMHYTQRDLYDLWEIAYLYLTEVS